MHVGIDARMGLHSGIGVYIRELATALLQADSNLRLTLFGYPGVWMSDEPRLRSLPFGAPIYGLRERLGWPAEASECDVLHAPHYAAPGRPPRPMVVTIHDLIHLLGPGALWGPKRWWAKRLMESSVRGAAAVVCDSEATRSDLVYHVKAAIRAPEKISVVPLAAGEEFHRPADLEEEARWRRGAGLPERYVLSVGIDKPHKRHLFSADLLARLRRDQGVEIPWVLLGPEERPSRAAHGERLAEIADLLVMPSSLPAERLPGVYRGAVALLIPSVREGFGLPAVEAMAAGCPVLAARAGSLPEVVGEGGLLLPPDEPEPWLEALKILLTDDGHRERMRVRGCRRAGRFRWSATATGMLDLFNGAMASRAR